MDDEPIQQPEKDAGWLEELADAALAPARFEDETPALALGPLNRERPERAPLIPKALWVTVAALAAVSVLAVGLAMWVGSRSAVVVPAVTGQQVAAARTVVTRAGMEFVITSQRFSTLPKGQVLSQNPPSGSTSRRGEVVEVVVSAGTEEFAMPDVVSSGVALATGILEERGLVVKVDLIISDAPSDTVLGSIPSPGQTVRTGDEVRLQVASPRGGGVTLRPYRLDGVSVVIDPAPVAGIPSDIAASVALKLRSLLEGSGASVRVTRSGIESQTADPMRAARAAESSSTLAIGLTVSTSGTAGRIVSSPASTTPVIGTGSDALASRIASSLTSEAAPVQQALSTSDTVLSAAASPWVRITLGSATAREDQVLFADPGWVDKVAQAVYMAIASIHGLEVTL